MVLTEIGVMVNTWWHKIFDKYPNTRIDTYMIMHTNDYIKMSKITIGRHLAHPPYFCEYANDILWVSLFISAGVIMWLSNMYAKTLFVVCLATLLTHNVLMILGFNGLYFYTRIILPFSFLTLIALIILGFFKGRKYSFKSDTIHSNNQETNINQSLQQTAVNK
jgi:hypothetical protein